MGEDLFKSYYKKMSRQGVLKALLLAMVIGFSCMLIMSLVSWIVGFSSGYWISIIVFAVVVLITTPIFYFTLYKPNTKQIAQKIDEFGLEERMITMTEYANDQSYIARRQREDALQALKTVNANLLKFVIATPVIISLAVVAVLGTSMTVVSGLGAHHIIPTGDDLVKKNDDDKETVFYEVFYDVDGEGEIIGEFLQIIEEGKDAEEVVAEAGDGYVFDHWVISDGNESFDDTENTEPVRQDLVITKNLYITAVFSEADPNGEGEGEGDGEGDGEGEGEGQGGEGQPGNGQPGNGQEGKPGQDGQGQPGDGEGGGAGGENTDNDKVFDGETDYGGPTYDNANSDSKSELDGNKDVSSGDKDIISDYFDTIKK